MYTRARCSILGPNDPVLYVHVGSGPLYGTLKLLVFGDQPPEQLQDPLDKAEKGGGVGNGGSPAPQQHGGAVQQPEPTTTMHYCLHLLFCIVGLQAAYLIWGVLQVRLKCDTHDCSLCFL